MKEPKRAKYDKCRDCHYSGDEKGFQDANAKRDYCFYTGECNPENDYEGHDDGEFQDEMWGDDEC